MFGYVKKEDVVNLITKEVDLNRKMFEKYNDLLETHSGGPEEDECRKREAQRCTRLADEYFARYEGSKEILAKVKKL